MPEPTEIILQQILCELQEIRNLLRPKKCSPADLQLLERLIPGIAGKFGSAPVRTCEILADPALRAIANSSPGAVGGLLARAADDEADIPGLRIMRAGREGNAVLWSVGRRLPTPMGGNGKF